MTRLVAMVLVVAALGLVTAPPAAAAGARLPVPGAVVRRFDPPAERWLAGHRGVDLAAPPGTAVLAPADGVVTFAGEVAGKPVVVVSHGAERSTLEPVEGTVPVGTRVAAGEQVGQLVAGHACPAEACLHWGVRRGDEYLDPLAAVDAPAVRLLPDDAAAGVTRRAAERALLALTEVAAGATGSGVLQRPVDAPITSPFGRRFHPIFHEWRLHAGVDMSAPCGTPIRAAGAGVVTHVGYDASGGWRLVVDHGSSGGARLETVYLHALGYTVRAGQQVAAGQAVGRVGSTGWSTGCHLHFSVKTNGRHVDPKGFL